MAMLGGQCSPCCSGPGPGPCVLQAYPSDKEDETCATNCYLPTALITTNATTWDNRPYFLNYGTHVARPDLDGTAISFDDYLGINRNIAWEVRPDSSGDPFDPVINPNAIIPDAVSVLITHVCNSTFVAGISYAFYAGPPGGTLTQELFGYFYSLAWGSNAISSNSWPLASDFVFTRQRCEVSFYYYEYNPISNLNDLKATGFHDVNNLPQFVLDLIDAAKNENDINHGLIVGNPACPAFPEISWEY